MPQPDLVAALDARIAHLTHCADAIKAGTCPLQDAPAKAVTPKPRKVAVKAKTPTPPASKYETTTFTSGRSRPGAKDARVLAHRAEKSRVVLAAIREAGAHGLTRHDLRGVTAFEVSSLCSIVDNLLHAGLVHEQGSRESGPFGRVCVVYIA